MKVKRVLNKGGFSLTKFISIKPEALVRLPETDVVGFISTQRILGVHWDTNVDALFVKTQIKHDFQGKNLTLPRTFFFNSDNIGPYELSCTVCNHHENHATNYLDIWNFVG